MIKAAYEKSRRMLSGGLAREAIGTFIVRFTGIALLFGCLTFLARYLGAHTYGQYTYVYNWLEILAVISLVGLNRGALRFIAAYRSQSEWRLLRGFIGRTSYVVLIISCAIAIICAGIIGFSGRNLEDGLIHVFWIGLVTLPLMALVQLTCACLQGFRRAALSLSPQVIRPLALIIGVLLIGELLGKRPSASEVFWIEAIVGILLLLLMRWFLSNSMLQQEHARAYRTREWISVAGPMLLISLVNIIHARTDIVMLGIFRGTTSAGYYTAASRVAGFVLFGLTTINLIMAPLISELFTQKRQIELQRKVTVIARVITLFAFLVALLVITGGAFILNLFGSDFVSAYQALVILTIGQFINALAGPIGNLMMMTCYQKETALILMISAGLNIVLNALLIPYYGLTGAALATSGSLVFWNLIMVILTFRRLGINPTVFRIKKVIDKG